MAISDHLDTEHWAGWEIDPSTRTSVHVWTKYVPFFGVVGTNGEFTPDGGSARLSLMTVDSDHPVHNLVKNPRIEDTDISKFVAVGGATSRARVQTQQAEGTSSIEVTPANTAGGGDGIYWVTPTMVGNVQTGRYLTASCEVRGASNSGTVKLAIQDSTGTELATSATHTFTTNFATGRLEVQYPISALTTATTYRIAIITAAQTATHFFVDKFMAEDSISNISSTYVDGDLIKTASGRHYEWVGTASKSESRVRPGIRVIRGIRIINISANPLYVGIDADLTTTNLKEEGIQVLQNETFETNFPIDARKKITVRTTGGNSTVHGVVWGIHEG